MTPKLIDTRSAIAYNDNFHTNKENKPDMKQTSLDMTEMTFCTYSLWTNSYVSIFSKEFRDVLLNFWAKPRRTSTITSLKWRVCTIISTSFLLSTTTLSRCWSLRKTSTWSNNYESNLLWSILFSNQIETEAIKAQNGSHQLANHVYNRFQSLKNLGIMVRNDLL